MMFPSMTPIKGIINWFFCGKDRAKNKNNNVPAKANKKAENERKSKEVLGRKSITTKIPKRALSIVPAVVGETNLFCVKCCMIKPQILLVAPAKIKQTVRGKRVAKNNCVLCPLNWSKSNS